MTVIIGYIAYLHAKQRAVISLSQLSPFNVEFFNMKLACRRIRQHEKSICHSHRASTNLKLFFAERSLHIRLVWKKCRTNKAMLITYGIIPDGTDLEPSIPHSNCWSMLLKAISIFHRIWPDSTLV